MMAKVDELRQAAIDAWKRGSMAETPVATLKRDKAIESEWRDGACCGEHCGRLSRCNNLRVNFARQQMLGHYFYGQSARELGVFCEHTAEGQRELLDLMNTKLFGVLLVKRLLVVVFGMSPNAEFSIFGKVDGMVEKTQLMEVRTLTKQLAELRTESADIVEHLALAVYQAEIVTMAMQLVRATIDKLAKLQGIPLGFEVDRQYSEAELIGPLTEAAATGVPFQGYAFGVVQGRFFCKVPGYEYLLKNKRGVNEWQVQIGDIEIIEEPGWIKLPKEKHYTNKDGKLIDGRKSHGRAKVEVVASITINGQEHRREWLKRTGDGQIDGRISLDMKTPGEDSLATRAKRRALKALWEIASGHNQAPDLDDGNVIDADYSTTTDAPAVPAVPAIKVSEPAPASAPAPQQATTATTSTPTPTQPEESRVSKMLAKFAELNVTVPQIRDRLKVDDLATIGEAEFSLLGTVYRAMTERNLTWEQTDE